MERLQGLHGERGSENLFYTMYIYLDEHRERFTGWDAWGNSVKAHTVWNTIETMKYGRFRIYAYSTANPFPNLLVDYASVAIKIIGNPCACFNDVKLVFDHGKGHWRLLWHSPIQYAIRLCEVLRGVRQYGFYCQAWAVL